MFFPLKTAQLWGEENELAPRMEQEVTFVFWRYFELWETLSQRNPGCRWPHGGPSQSGCFTLRFQCWLDFSPLSDGLTFLGCSLFLSKLLKWISVSVKSDQSTLDSACLHRHPISNLTHFCVPEVRHRQFDLIGGFDGREEKSVLWWSGCVFFFF